MPLRMATLRARGRQGRARHAPPAGASDPDARPAAAAWRCMSWRRAPRDTTHASGAGRTKGSVAKHRTKWD